MAASGPTYWSTLGNFFLKSSWSSVTRIANFVNPNKVSDSNHPHQVDENYLNAPSVGQQAKG